MRKIEPRGASREICTHHKAYISFFCFLFNEKKSNSSSLYTFHEIWLIEGKVLHFNEVQSKNRSDLFSFRLKRLTFWQHYDDEVLIIISVEFIDV